MFVSWCQVANKKYLYKNSIRYLTTSEIATALRPFYFSVHPDLFGKYPLQQETNENSLKQLSLFLQTIQNKKPLVPINLKFYLRKKDTEGEFNLVNVSLKSNNVRTAVLTILSACNLPTNFVDNIKSAQNELNPNNNLKSNQSPFDDLTDDELKTKFNKRAFWRNEFNFSKFTENDSTYGETLLRRLMNIEKQSTKLKSWLRENETKARIFTESGQPVRDEIERLRKNLCKNLQLKSIEWECGWDISHFRGCLLAFSHLIEHHPNVTHTLRERTLVFAPFTGVSLDGYILLGNGEVRNNWLDLLKNVQKYDSILMKVPQFEKAVSNILREIKIGRRKFMPKIMAHDYENNLRSVMTSLNDYKSFQDFPSNWPQTLDKYELVVETEAGPLMLSPTGQFIIPSSCPGFLLVNFINENMAEADRRLAVYKLNKPKEKELHELLVRELKLKALYKDDCITPELMIPCCERLLKSRDQIKPYVENLSINITKFYSVMTDGVMSIPWNWEL